jgi:hypothetical protein
VYVKLCIDKEYKDCEPNLPPDYMCTNIGGRLQDAITSYVVQKGCCIFFQAHGRKRSMFEAFNRSHWKLGSVSLILILRNEDAQMRLIFGRDN